MKGFFNSVFSLNLAESTRVRGLDVRNLAVKKNILGSEVMFIHENEPYKMLVCELPDDLRNLINSIEVEGD